MNIAWGIIYALPLLACGALAIVSPAAARRALDWFRYSRATACVLTVSAWTWTAYECDTIGIAAFDRFTKAFPFELPVLAVVLSYLTIIWMEKHLAVRALCGLLMLAPSSVFASVKAFRPEQGTLFAASDILVYAAYAGAILGMYGMFYPWRVERAAAALLNRPRLARAAGAAVFAAGAAVAAAAFAM